MSDLNLCVFTGRLGREIELRHTASGVAVCSPSIAVGGRKKVGETWEEVVEWVPLVMWQRTAEIAAQYLTKGSHIRVTGRFQTRSYEKDGQKHYRSEIVVSEMQMLGGKSDSQARSGDSGGQARQNHGQSPSAAPSAPQQANFDDDVPF